MKINKLRFIFSSVLAASLLFFGTAQPAVSAPLSWEQAAEMIQSGNSKDAVVYLESLLATDPRNALYLRLKGIAELQLGREDAAAASLREAVRNEPTCIACGFYLAQALAARGSLNEAIQLLKTISREVPNSRYAEQANKILPELERLSSISQAVQDKRRWNISARTAFEYDDNVANSSRHEPHTGDSLRLTLSSYTEVRPIDQNIDRLPFTLGAGYAAYQSFHDRGGKYDLTSQTARVLTSHAGRIKNLPYRFELKNDYTDMEIEGNNYSREISLTPEFELQWLPWTLSSISYGIAWKDFAQDTLAPELFSRDGRYHRLGFLERFFVLKNRATFDLRYDYSWNDTQGSQFNDQKGHGVSAAFNVSLPWKLRAATGLGYQSGSYPKFAPAPKRFDNEWTTWATLARPLWIPQVMAELTYTHSSTVSKQDFADSSRNVYGLAFSYYY